MANITAQLIATLIDANCDAHHAGQKSRDEWSKEQYRLWDLAEAKRVSNRVKMLLAPKLLPVPPYSVRKQLRDATLAAGR